MNGLTVFSLKMFVFFPSLTLASRLWQTASSVHLPAETMWDYHPQKREVIIQTGPSGALLLRMIMSQCSKHSYTQSFILV